MLQVGILFIVILSQFNVALIHEEENDADFITSNGRPQVEVRAVFINCEPEVLSVAPESEVTRFQRDELFKHNVLKDCSKKLALTVKITSESGNFGDEYLPIEHVFEGSSEKRVRLLDPYILRLRRDMPRQAYMLRRLDTVSCVISNDAINENNFGTSRSRIQREVDPYSEVVDSGSDLKSELNNFTPFKSLTLMSTVMVAHDLDKSDDNHVCSSNNSSLNTRRKRNERNLVVETVTQDNTKWAHDDNFYGVLDRDRKSHINEFDEQGIDMNSYKSVQPNLEKGNSDNKRAIVKNPPRKTAAGSHSIVKTKTVGFAHDEPKVEDDDVEESVNPLPTTDKMSHERTFSGKPHSNAKIKYSDSQKNESEENENIEDSNSPNPTSKQHNGIKKVKSKDKRRDYSTHVVYSNEKDYAVYEIGSPDLWHTVHVQLFEKLSTPEGKTVWNDLTKGELASVGSITPMWAGQDLNVKYRSTKWMPKEDFVLPSESRFCLLVPISDSRVDSYASPNSSSYDTYDDSDYIVVPEEEIQGVNDDAKLTENNSEPENSVNLSENIEQTHRRVTIRASRAVLKGDENKLNIASQGSDKYLTIFHQRPLRAQIDLEARADENQLVRIGDSGRISIAVSDCTRRARSILNLQVGNTGLAAARFRVVARDCYPLLTDLTKEKEVTTAGPIMIPPRHTRSIHLELPVEIPADDAHCSVSLINDDGQSVAVRDVSIKKGDRCFCVWHCDCVCLSVDPKLMCHDMDEAGQKAAGLSTRDRVRHTRSVYCPNDVSVNILTIITGVVVFLFLMGLCKAILGLICPCIGIWGLPLLIHGPQLDHYFEKSLCCRCVVYDEDGWPIHPDTKKRTVRVVRLPLEFVLNTIFFVCVPCMVIYDAFKLVYARYSKKKANSNSTTEAKNKDNTNKVFSTHDIQEMAPRWRRRRDGLRRWMTPQAQELSTELWQRSLKIHPADYNDFMQPLLRDQRVHDNRSRMTRETPDSCMDSEQDDTEYVLTQMQKSRESLARSQKKMNSPDPPSQAPPGSMEHIKK